MRGKSSGEQVLTMLEILNRESGTLRRRRRETTLVLPRVSKRLTMGRSAEGHAWRLVSLRREAAGVVALAELVQL